MGYSLIHSDQLSPIHLRDLSGGLAKGYQGDDPFRVVEGCLMGRFPSDKPGDSHA